MKTDIDMTQSALAVDQQQTCSADDIVSLAQECGAQVKPNPLDPRITLLTFTMEELLEFLSEVMKPNGESSESAGRKKTLE